MPEIRTSKGKIHYNTIPLYCGFTRIDKVIEEENLLLFKEVMDKHGIPFVFLGGTLMGAVREKDFISHDDDIDLGIDIKNLQSVIDILPEFIDKGFAIARYDRRCIISIIRKGQYVDLAFFEKYNETTSSCSGWLVLTQFLEDTDYIEFKGEKYLAPREYKEYLRCEFGDNWMTPIVFFDFNQPKWKIAVIKLSEKIKGALPDFIYFPLKRRAEKKVAADYQHRIDIYLEKKRKEHNLDNGEANK